MQKTLLSIGYSFKKSTQISEFHCGPAVLQMLLTNIGIYVSQKAITKAAGITKTISTHGTRIDQMGKAIKKLKLPVSLWYKTHCTVSDIRTLLDTYNYPVGVEWQGLFSDEEEEPNDDSGHYSVVARVDTARSALIIVDPYKDFATQDRIIKIDTFLKRWWDENQVPRVGSKKAHTIRDERLLFIVTKSDVTPPDSLGLTHSSAYNGQISEITLLGEHNCNVVRSAKKALTGK
jgi:hypothetical protein